MNGALFYAIVGLVVSAVVMSFAKPRPQEKDAAIVAAVLVLLAWPGIVAGLLVVVGAQMWRGEKP